MGKPVDDNFTVDPWVALEAARRRFLALLHNPQFPQEERHETAVALDLVVRALERLAS